MSTSGLTRQYALFISYRHADNLQLGRKWATWLHEAVENYEIPADLIGRENLRHETIPSSLYPVFRDEEELPADADLSINIRRALENSALLVVICSPRAVQSRFVADEIRHFKEIGKSGRILALMIDGEPNASDDPEKMTRLGPETECFPEPLRFGVPSEDGTIDWTARTEPIAADCRPGGYPVQGWTTAAAYDEHLHLEGTLTKGDRLNAVKAYAERLELARLKVIAGALGVPLGELTQRDKARQLIRAKKRARILTSLSVVFAALAGVAAILGWVANTQRQAAEDARSRADREKQHAVQTLAASDFLEGTNRLEAPKTAPQGLAYLARSARAGHTEAATRIWTLWQQRSFWIPQPSASKTPFEASSQHLTATTPPERFASVLLDDQAVPPTWYAQSADGKRCVTIVSAALAGEGPITFRVWQTSGEPLTDWLTIDYEGDYYLSSLDAATLSEDGRFLALLATPWRSPQFVEVWDINKARRVGDRIPASGGHPNYQGGAFTDVWFTPHPKDTLGPFLVTLSNRGDASVQRVDAGEEPAMWTAFTNSHDQPVTRAFVSKDLQFFASAAIDGSVHIADLSSEAHLGWPIKLDSPALDLRLDSATQISVLFENHDQLSWQLIRAKPTPLPVQTDLLQTKDTALQKNWDSDEKTPKIQILDQRESLVLQGDGPRIEIIDSSLPGSPRQWQHTFTAPVVIARFVGTTQILVQTSFFTTALWDFSNDQSVGTAIDESALFKGPDSASDTALLSTLSPDGRLLLTRSFRWIPPNLGINAFTIWDPATGRPLTDRMLIADDIAGDETSPNHAEFSADGLHLLLGKTGEGPSRVTRAIQLSAPGDLSSLAEALAGFKLLDDGSFKLLAPGEFEIIQQFR